MSGPGRPCVVCSDPRRPALEEELRSPGRPSYAQLADSYRPISSQAIRRHHLTHLAQTQPKREEDVEALVLPESGGDPVAFGRRLEEMVMLLVDEAATTGQFKDLARALQVGLEAHGAFLKAYASRAPEFDPLRDAVLSSVRDRLVAALADEPAALAKVLAALRGKAA